MALNLNHPDGIQDAMQTAVRASRLEVLVRQMSTSQTIVNSMCNRALSILLASIAEAIVLSSVELANALNLDMRGPSCFILCMTACISKIVVAWP